MVNIKCDTIHYHNRMQCNQEAFATVEIAGLAPHNKCLLHLHTAAAAKQPITKIRALDPGYQYVADKILDSLVQRDVKFTPKEYGVVLKVETAKEAEKKLPVISVKASSN